MTQILYTVLVGARHIVEVSAGAAVHERQVIEATGEALEGDLPFNIPPAARANDVIPFAAVLRRVI